MTRRNVQVLAAVVAGLVLLLFVLESTDDTGQAPEAGRLLADFEPVGNEITEVTIIGPREAEAVKLAREADGWSVASRYGYPADIGKLRQLVVSLVEAVIIEEKTADPANYDRLGVGDPTEGGDGTQVTLGGADFSFAVILGSTARGDLRYARRGGEAISYLIDRAPEAPVSQGDWLLADLVDVGSERIRRVTITHADGETIVVEKSEPEAAFTVLDVPEARELSYPSAGNSIGGALTGLALEDVRPATDGDVDITTTFETFDDAVITVTIRRTDENVWVAFSAEPDVDGINERLQGWEYRLPKFKQDPLMRRWSDLLKPEETPDES